METLQPSILAVGDFQRPDFRAAWSSFASLAGIAYADDSTQAAAMLADGSILPDLIVVAQAYPGQISPAAINTLRRSAPLARVVGLLGSWCEGELRSGRPWPGATRIYWHQWPARWQRELDHFARGECPTWGLPLTASEDDRLLLETPSLPTSPRQGLIAIDAQRQMAQWLAAACQAEGYETLWVRPAQAVQSQGAVAAIFDDADGRGIPRQRLSELAAATPTVALLSFPRREDIDRAEAAGAKVVLSKPLLLADLSWALDRATQG